MRLKPTIQRIMNLLRKEGFEIQRMRGDHIIINKSPSLVRPIVLVNEKRLSNAVQKNLIKQCQETGMNTEKLEELF